MRSVSVKYLDGESEIYQGVAIGMAIETYVLQLYVTMRVTQLVKYFKLACELYTNITKLFECK